MNIKKISAFLLSFAILLSVGTMLVGAQPERDENPERERDENVEPIKFPLDNPFAKGGDSLFGLLEIVINDILLPIGGVLAVLAFIYSGFLYVTAAGNETKLKTANKALLYTAIGTAVLLGSWVLANVIENTINKLQP